MGTFAEGSVNIYFSKKEDADKVHEMLKKSEAEVEQEFIKILGEEKGKGYYNFYDFNDNGSQSVDFMLSSGRIQNAEWQVDQIIKVLKHMVKSKEIEGVEELSCSMMMEADGRYVDADEFAEGGEDE